MRNSLPALGWFPGPAAGVAAVAGRDLSGVGYIYLWADGIHVNLRSEEHKGDGILSIQRS